MTFIKKLVKVRFPMFDREFANHNFITEAFTRVWGEVPNTLSEVKINTLDGRIEIYFNWEDHTSKIIENTIKNDYFTTRFTDEKFAKKVIEEKYIDLECNIKLLRNDNYQINLTEGEIRVIAYHIENLIFQFFLAMNIATPGSFNPFSRELQVNSHFEIYEYSSSCIESAWIESTDNGWPTISSIEISRVWNWIQSLNLGYRQIAQNRTERALFSILHLCKEDKVSPTQLIWISFALEALYDTPKAQINKTLIERISLVLGIPDDIKRKYKKKINEFYDLRSRFVHGELDIATPLSNEILDDKCSEYQAIIIEYCDFGLSIILATLQKMIQNEWKTLHFEENYYGDG
jgi:Apea-like HEPN